MKKSGNVKMFFLRAFIESLKGVGKWLPVEPQFRKDIATFNKLKHEGETWGSIASALDALGMPHAKGAEGIEANLKSYWSRNKSLMQRDSLQPGPAANQRKTREPGQRTRSKQSELKREPRPSASADIRAFMKGTARKRGSLKD